MLPHSAFFTVQLSHPYMTTGKTITLTRWTVVGKVISLLFNMLSIELLYYPAIPFLGIYLEKIIIQKDTCTPMFIAALFAITKT